MESDHHRAIVQFMPCAESEHAPVALASMAAKLTRELLMARFNRHWGRRVPDLKPTAGYSADARRWLVEMRDVLHPAEREALIRLA
jgi:ribonuclease HII